MVKKYSLKADGNKQLSEHLKLSELRCKDGSDIIYVDDKLPPLFEKIRKEFNKPVRVTSGYRTPSYNKGASRSQHMAGCALDITIAGVRPRTIAQFAMTLPEAVGVGLYEYGSGTQGFCHIDTGTGGINGVPARTHKTTWYQDNPKGPEKRMPNIGSYLPTKGPDDYLYKIRASATNLRMRSGPSTAYHVEGYCPTGELYVTDEKPGTGASKWCKISGGWVSADYVTKL